MENRAEATGGEALANALCLNETQLLQPAAAAVRQKSEMIPSFSQSP
jgi:hypothetical protein